MKRLTVVVCNHGLGHLKRVLHVLKTLSQENINEELEINVFTDLKKLEYFPSLVRSLKEESRKINFINLQADVLNYEKELVSQYKDYLEQADYVWSDNLLFPLKYKDDVFLSGSFLWMDEIDELGKEAELLRNKSPIMIGSKYFATPSVSQLRNFTGVGIYDYTDVAVPQRVASGILLSCGKSETGQRYFRESLQDITEQLKDIPEAIHVYVEPEYFEQLKVNKNISKAQFNEKMFGSIGAGVIRPGLGTISDCLAKGVRVFPFFEDDNHEAKHNRDILETLDVGEGSSSVKEALKAATSYVQDVSRHQRHLSAIKRLDFQGVRQTASKIREVISQK